MVLPTLGAPSEVWTLRQARAFRVLQPWLIYWQRHHELPFDVDHSMSHIAAPWQHNSRVLRRLQRSLPLWQLEVATSPGRSELRAILDAASPSVALCHFGWTGVKVSAAWDGPVFWHFHGRDISSSLRVRSYRAALEHYASRIAGAIVVGKFQARAVAALGVPEDRISVIPCGAPYVQFSGEPIPRRESGPLKTISVSRLSREKGIMESLLATKRALEQGAEVTYTIVGDGPELAGLRAATTDFGLDGHVEFTGALAPTEIARLLPQHHVFIQHSRVVDDWIEGFGVSITEACAAGLPIVATNTGGIPDQVVTGHNGVLIDEGDVDSQAAALLRLHNDEGLRRLMAANARTGAMTFDSDRMTRTLEDLLLEAAR